MANLVEKGIYEEVLHTHGRLGVSISRSKLCIIRVRPWYSECAGSAGRESKISRAGAISARAAARSDGSKPHFVSYSSLARIVMRFKILTHLKCLKMVATILERIIAEVASVVHSGKAKPTA